MINLLFRARPWHLFLLTFGLPMVIYLLLMVSLITTFLDNPEAGPQWIVNYLLAFPMVMLISFVTLEAWQWSVVTGCQRWMPQHAKPKMQGFKIFFLYQLLYLPAVLLAVFALLNTITDLTQPEEIAHVVIWIPLFIPLHLFAIFCQIYCLYITAKAIKTVELQREPVFSDFAGEFFLIWFFMIGVWILQPKLNKWVANPPTVRQHIT